MRGLGWWIAGGVAAAGGLGLWLYERSKPAPAPAIPATTPPSTSTNSNASASTATPATTTPPASTTTTPTTDTTNTLPAAANATAPSAPTVSLRPLTAGGGLTQGQIYLFAGLVPSGVTTAADMHDALVAAGWGPSVMVLWFGPTQAIDHTGGVIDNPALTNFLLSGYAVAFGQWAGATNTIMPSGTTFWAPVVISGPSS